MLSDSILDLAKGPNRKTWTFTFMRFLLGHFLRSKIESESNFLKKYYVITSLKKIWSILAHIKPSTKIDFPLHFQILRGRVQGFFFQARKLIFFQLIIPYYSQSNLTLPTKFH